MWELTLAVITGIVTGAIFTFLKLPIPAPPVWPGVLGIAGVLVGSQLMQWFLSR